MTQCRLSSSNSVFRFYACWLFTVAKPLLIRMCDYKDWKLGQLKEELRKRNVRVSGRKADLICRLMYLDSVDRKGEEPEPGTFVCLRKECIAW